MSSCCGACSGDVKEPKKDQEASKEQEQKQGLTSEQKEQK